jgi:hypothetical protein
MSTPTLTFNLFRSQTEETVLLSTMIFQHHDKDQEVELFDYDYDRRGQWFSIPRGTINAREHVAGILHGTENKGYIYSFAKAYAENNDIHPNDHLIATFSGYGDCTGWTYIIELGYYKTNSTKNVKPVIDDYDLLTKKYSEICNT